MEDVLKLYEKPPSERESVVCVDEKPVVLHADDVLFIQFRNAPHFSPRRLQFVVLKQDADRLHQDSQVTRFLRISTKPCQPSPVNTRHGDEVQQVP